MRLLVAATSSDRSSSTVPGELVHLPVSCCEDADCSCHGSLCGLATQGTTTMAQVRELDLDRATFVQLLWDSLERKGWVEAADPTHRAWVEDFATEHLELASHLPPETPVEFSARPLSDDDAA